MTRAAKRIDGVKACKADRKARSAEVTYDPSKTTPETIAKMISDRTGFKTTVPKKRKTAARHEGVPYGTPIAARM